MLEPSLEDVTRKRQVEALGDDDEDLVGGGGGKTFSSWSDMKIPATANAVTASEIFRRVWAGSTV